MRNALSTLCLLALGATAANMVIYYLAGARGNLIIAAVFAWIALAAFIGWEIVDRRSRRRG